MLALTKHSAQHALLRQAMRNCSPAVSIAVNQSKNIFRYKTDSFGAPSPSRKAHTFVDRYSGGGSRVSVGSISIDNLHSPVSARIHLPLHVLNEQTRFKSALFDHHDYDLTEHLKKAFDPDFYKKTLEINTKVYNDILKQAEEVLRGHIHDRSTNNIKILDLASGPGEPALTLAKNFPEAIVSSIDINPGMVKAAKKRAKDLGITNMETAVGDMEDLSDFGDGTFDLVTCAFGLVYCGDPEMALYEAHRVLKPGGTLIATAWDNMSTERASNDLLKAACGNRVLPDRVIDPMAMAQPRLLENLLEENHLPLVKVTHGEYPFKISGSNDHPEDFIFRFVSMPIYPNLAELVESGENSNAFEDAKKEFRAILSGDNGWIKQDEAGDIETIPNRYKLAVARRGYEKRAAKKKPVIKTRKQLNLYPGPHDMEKITPAQVSEAFDSVLIDTYSRISNGPWEHVVRLVEGIVHGQDMSKVRILDLSAGPGEPACMLAKRFPRSSVVATDASVGAVDRMKKKVERMGLRNMRVIVADPQSLSSFQTASYDVVTCSFGLSLTDEGAKKALDEVHRILKPGGSFVAAVWDSISLEHISDEIMAKVLEGEQSPPRVIDFLSFAEPRKLEGVIESSGMSIIRVDHDEFSFQLSGLGHQPDDFAFNVATIPIHPNLVNMQESGKKPNAFEEAQDAFQNVVDQGDLVHVDSQGRMWTGPNRFKLVVARRQYEDSDVGP